MSGDNSFSQDPSAPQPQGEHQQASPPPDPEIQDGIRFSWNYFPRTRLEAQRMIVPLGCLYSPIKAVPNMPVVNYSPVRCKGPCHSVLNPFCAVDFNSKMWICPFCLFRNQFPPQYGEISESNLPAELVPQFTTMEYILHSRPPNPPVFLFLVDTCQDADEFNAVRENLVLAISLLPRNAVIGFISFGTFVNVHELRSSNLCNKAYILRGTRDYSTQEVGELLSFQAQKGIGARGASRFFLPLSECEETLNTLLDELTPDAFPPQPECRPLRCTGAAMSIAVGMMELAFPGIGGRMVSIIGGPCTSGPGKVVMPDLKQRVRSHHDLQKETNLKWHVHSRKFYASLAKRLHANGHSMDILTCSLDQIGLMEMAQLLNIAGGAVVQAASFQSPVFRQSFQKLFTPQLKTETIEGGVDVTIELCTSRDLKVSGCIGSVSSLNKKTSAVSDSEIGVGGTIGWKTSEIGRRDTLAFFLDVSTPGSGSSTSTSSTAAGPPSHQSLHNPSAQQSLLQFVTQYQGGDGFVHLHVSTVARAIVDTHGGDIHQLGEGFDQECAAVLMARIASYKAQKEPQADVMRWLDKTLIRISNRFGSFEKDSPSTFSLSPQFSFYPQFMFHLRRSPFLQVFNYSPDETAYQRVLLNRADTTDSLLMIQPTLFSYSFNGPPAPSLLDIGSVKPDVILLLDTFFRVIVFHGEAVTQWRRKGIQDSPEHSNFKELLSAPKEDAKSIVRSRFPVPTYIECDQHDSQSRFVICVLNPSVTHANENAMSAGAEVVFTDDVSLQVFMEHLKRMAVSQQ